MKRERFIYGMIAAALIVVIILTAAVAFAQNWPFVRNAQPFTDLSTMVSATTTTVVTGPTVTLGMPFSRFTCQTLWSGGSLSTTSVGLQGSIDGTNYMTIHSRVSSTSPDIWSAQTSTVYSFPGVFYFRGFQTLKTGLASSIGMTELKCFGH